MTGWVKLHRKLAEWEWYHDTNTTRLFIHLLIFANHKRGKWHGIDILPGQLIVGRKSLSEKLNMPEQAIRTCLNRLKSTNEITSKSTNKFTVITLINWEYYQSCATESTNESTSNLTNNQPTTNQQLTNNQPHFKNNKNKENENNDENNNKLYLSVPSESAKPKQTIKEKIQITLNEYNKTWNENEDFYKSKYPNLDYDLQKNLMLSWIEEKPTKSLKKKSWHLFIQKWLSSVKPNYKSKFNPPAAVPYEQSGTAYFMNEIALEQEAREKEMWQKIAEQEKKEAENNGE